MITQKDFMKLKDARERALTENDTPYLVVNNDELHVAGNANKTQVVKKDYIMSFLFPNEWKDRFDPKDILKEGATHFMVEMEYPDVTITPRNHVDAITALVELEPFFNKIMDDGDVKDLTPEDIRDILRYMNEEMRTALYHAVGTILKVDKSIEDYMNILDVIMVAAFIMRDFPEAINEANALFEFSAERARSRANL